MELGETGLRDDSLKFPLRDGERRFVKYLLTLSASE